MKNNIILQKCLNILRTISESDAFIPKYLDSIEKVLIPLFEYMEFPERIEFDDEILQIITNFMKRTKQLTPV